MKELNPNSWHFKVYEYLYKNWTYPFAHNYGVAEDVDNVDLCTYLRGLSVTPLSVIFVNLVSIVLIPLLALYLIFTQLYWLNVLVGLAAILGILACTCAGAAIVYYTYQGLRDTKDKVTHTATFRELVKGYNKVFCPILKVQR